MKLRFLCSLIAAVTLVCAANVNVAEAGLFRQWRFSGRYRPAARAYAPRYVSGGGMVRQVDGRSLWDLGKQNGQWPSLP
jgi:hypothetical protein